MFRSKKSMLHFAVVRTVLLLLLASGPPLYVNAQVVGGTIQGTITDPHGGAVPDARVEIKNLSTHIITTSTSNSDGLYTAPNLLPGDYKVTATRSGFSITVTQLTLNVGA